MKPKYRLKIALVVVKDRRRLADAENAISEMTLLDLSLDSLAAWHTLISIPKSGTVRIDRKKRT